MKKTLAALVMGIGLAGCMPLSTYYKEGVSVERLNRDLTNCKVVGVNKVPANTQIRSRPSYYIPAQRICDAAGKCVYREARWEGGEAYTVDANARLRGQVIAQCMSDKGYAYVELPPCSSQVARQVPPGATRLLPRLTPTSCVVRDGSGHWQIVSPVRK